MGFADELRSVPSKRAEQEEQDWLDFIDYLMDRYIKGCCMLRARDGESKARISLNKFYEHYFKKGEGIGPDGRFLSEDYRYDDQWRVRVCRKFVKEWSDSRSYDPENEMPNELRLKPTMATRLERDIKARIEAEGLTVEKIVRKEDSKYLCWEIEIWVKW